MDCPPAGGGGMDCPKRPSAVASDFPEDLFVEILARVPARSLCRSKCVAKAWRDIIEDPFHRKKLPQTLQGFFSIPCDTPTVQHIGYASVLARSRRLQIDNPSLSFLTKFPGFESLTFLDSCNGLLVFEHIDKSLGYVVCNPSTNQWGAVPRCGPLPSSTYHRGTKFMYLVFDPAVSSHFHLVQFVTAWEVVDDDEIVIGWEEDVNDNDEEASSTLVNVYSSESGQWIQSESDWYKHHLEEWDDLGPWSAVLNGMLHFIVHAGGQVQIAAVDVQGVTRKIISVPITARMMISTESSYVAQSQGRLHYINKTIGGQRVSIWVLKDYDTQKWVLKHSVNFKRLFAGRMGGRRGCRGYKGGYSVVAVHPDGNVVFLVLDWNRKLISYDMDHKLVKVIGTLEDDTSTMDAVPYVPCFLVSPALTNTL